MSDPSHSDHPNQNAPDRPSQTNLILGISVLALALVIAFVWVPNGVESGIFEKVRRRVEIGDSFAPTLAAGLLGLGGLILILESLRRPSDSHITRQNVTYIAALCAVFALFTALLMWTGPALVALLAEDGAEYRLLRDTVPWKYAGFALGGTVLVTGLISAVERRLTLQNVLIGIAASLAMIALYDLPFDDLLLPPNGDY